MPRLMLSGSLTSSLCRRVRKEYTEMIGQIYKHTPSLSRELVIQLGGFSTEATSGTTALLFTVQGEI